jgi:CO/xanthine dehydrogenase FAD-binding subunit
MQAFSYIPTKTIEETVSILSKEGDQARVLSGGTDLLVQMREGRRKVGTVIDIKGVPDVNELSFDTINGLHIGAAVPCYRIYGDRAIAAAYPGLIDAAALIGGVQIQGRASLGGNLCNASPAADSIPALIVYQATCIIAGLNGRRTVPVEDFCVAPGRTVLQRGEILVAIHLPTPARHSGAAYLRFIPRNEMDIAVVGAGASVVLDESRAVIESARISLGAVAPTPLFVSQAGQYLAGRQVSTEAIDEAARIARSAARPITDMRGTVSQRIHLSAVLVRRSLVIAIERAKK